MAHEKESESRVNEQTVMPQERATAMDERADSIADSIAKVAAAFDQLLSSGLTERAIVLLLHDAISRTHGTNAVPQTHIRRVLEAARKMPELYLTNARAK